MQANDDLRVATAYTVSRVRRAMQHLDAPPNSAKSQGRLLKGKLKPLRPVQVKYKTHTFPLKWHVYTVHINTTLRNKS